MTKFEFLGDLSRLIADLPEEDREQAMEYYEDYFADAGPDREQEIIKEFISPAYIAEQLREASAQRLAEEGNMPFTPPKKVEKPAVFSRKSAAQAAQAQNQSATSIAEPSKTGQSVPAPQQTSAPQATPAAPVPQQASAPQSTPAAPVSQQASASQATPAAPVSQQASASQATPAAPAPQQASAPQTEQNAEDKEKKAYESLAMRNPIFQQRTAESVKEEEELLALKQKTKIDVKSINKNTSQVSKADKKAAKQRAAEEKAYNSTLYSSSKKATIAVVLVITSPIWLSLLGIILGLFALVIGLVLALVALGVVAILGSVLFLLLTILAISSLKIPNAIFALGFALLLFSIGCGICYGDYKIFTRVIPSTYYTLVGQIGNLKLKLNRLAMK